ncbi:MAG: geranylgeranyl reductase family protein [Acidimicrobiales bacterium]
MTFEPNPGTVHDVVVIGGGPSGSSCAYWLADAGWDVVLVEKKRFPRDKTCGDGLTPRAVRQIEDMGLGGAMAGSHKYVGLRSCAFGKTLEMHWPEHPSFPSYGYTITRRNLDQLVAERAAKAGAHVLQGTEANEVLRAAPGNGHTVGLTARDTATADSRSIPVLDGVRVSEVASKETGEIKARYVVIADGSNSRIGRSLGTSRDRNLPLGMALRGYYNSPRHDDPYIESHLEIRDADGELVPGYGWIFPLGDGRVNVGVGLLTVNGRWKGVNTTRLMDAFVARAPGSWGLSEATSCGPPTGGKLPMGLALRPRTGPNAICIGDAAGSINPFNGEGIAYGYETGRLAAACISNALAGRKTSVGEDYERRLHEAYGDYYRVARAFVKLISNPQVLRACVQTGMHVPPVMNGLLRIMANLMRPDSAHLPEMSYRAMEAVGRRLPDASDD